jgi:hypothetical protein
MEHLGYGYYPRTTGLHTQPYTISRSEADTLAAEAATAAWGAAAVLCAPYAKGLGKVGISATEKVGSLSENSGRDGYPKAQLRSMPWSMVLVSHKMGSARIHQLVHIP